MTISSPWVIEGRSAAQYYDPLPWDWQTGIREGSAMATIVVVHRDVHGDEQSDDLQAEGWRVDDGVLTVLDAQKFLVATYAAGEWLNVLRKPE